MNGKQTKLEKMVSVEMEVCRSEGLGLNSTFRARPPWWVIRYKGQFWDSERWNYCWFVYGGPPKVYLTRKKAEISAKAFKKQYGGGRQCGNGPLIVEIVKIEPE